MPQECRAGPGSTLDQPDRMELVGREPATNHAPVPLAAGEANTPRERVSEVVDAPSMSRVLELGVAMRTELETFEAGPPGGAAAHDPAGISRAASPRSPTDFRLAPLLVFRICSRP